MPIGNTFFCHFQFSYIKTRKQALTGRVCFFSDGVVTKDEMKAYFLKANYRALGRDFIHNFQETTYLTPNFCEHCGGVVSIWCIIIFTSDPLTQTLVLLNVVS